jgi:hypothetical protein
MWYGPVFQLFKLRTVIVLSWGRGWRLGLGSAEEEVALGRRGEEIEA